MLKQLNKLQMQILTFLSEVKLFVNTIAICLALWL